MVSPLSPSWVFSSQKGEMVQERKEGIIIFSATVKMTCSCQREESSMSNGGSSAGFSSQQRRKRRSKPSCGIGGHRCANRTYLGRTTGQSRRNHSIYVAHERLECGPLRAQLGNLLADHSRPYAEFSVALPAVSHWPNGLHWSSQIQQRPILSMAASVRIWLYHESVAVDMFMSANPWSKSRSHRIRKWRHPWRRQHPNCSRHGLGGSPQPLATNCFH